MYVGVYTEVWCGGEGEVGVHCVDGGVGCVEIVGGWSGCTRHKAQGTRYGGIEGWEVCGGIRKMPRRGCPCRGDVGMWNGEFAICMLLADLRGHDVNVDVILASISRHSNVKKTFAMVVCTRLWWVPGPPQGFFGLGPRGAVFNQSH